MPSLAGCRLRLDCVCLFAGFGWPVRDQCASVRGSMQIMPGGTRMIPHPTTAPVPNYQAEAEKPVKGLRYWHPEGSTSRGHGPEVRKRSKPGLRCCARLGCEIREIRCRTRTMQSRFITHRDRGGQVSKPGFAMTRAVRIARRWRFPAIHVPEDARAGIWRRGETADRARDVTCSLAGYYARIT